MTGSEETTSTPGFTFRKSSTRNAGVSNHICIPTFGGPLRHPDPLDELAQEADHLVDLAPDGAEDEDVTAVWTTIDGLDSGGGEARPDLGLLPGEGDDRRRALDRDDRSWLHAIGAEEVPVVVVVEDDDRHHALLAHAGLDAGDPIVANVHVWSSSGGRLERGRHRGRHRASSYPQPRLDGTGASASPRAWPTRRGCATCRSQLAQPPKH